MDYSIGERIIIKISKLDILYKKISTKKNVSDSTVYRLVDDKGTIFVWSTSQIVEINDKIKATICGRKRVSNRFNIYGEEQLVITRCRLINEKPQIQLRGEN